MLGLLAPVLASALRVHLLVWQTAGMEGEASAGAQRVVPPGCWLC